MTELLPMVRELAELLQIKREDVEVFIFCCLMREKLSGKNDKKIFK
jgi:hypothetical protein